MSNTGKISQVIGAVVDVEFEEKMPDILNALKIEQKGDPAKGTLDFDITLEVALHLGDGKVRTVPCRLPTVLSGEWPQLIPGCRSQSLSEPERSEGF